MPSPTAATSTAKRSWSAKRGHHRHVAEADEFNAKAEARFGKRDFHFAEKDIYICPAGERLTYRYTNEENGLVLRRYWTNACPNCPIKHQCTRAPHHAMGKRAHSCSGLAPAQ
jgi:hypothetical protein